MTESQEVDIFEGIVYLSDVRWEHFHIVMVTGTSTRIIHPIAKKANQKVRIIGPNESAQGKCWLIDGRPDRIPEGTPYKIRFEWRDSSMSITWEPLKGARKAGEGEAYVHRYYICSSMSSWTPVIGNFGGEMPAEPGLWEFVNGSMGQLGAMEFMFLRDADKSQIIYPMEHHPTNDSIPIMGPDEGGVGKRWILHGTPGENIQIRITILDGAMTLKVWTQTMGEIVYRSNEENAGQLYFLVGSWNNWNMTKMETDIAARRIYSSQFIIGPTGREQFQIIENQNWHQRLYPLNHRDPPGVGLMCGPDQKGKNKNWEVTGPPGQMMQITLNFDAEDHCSMVMCVPCT